eukprot:8605207-Heterocapsa_arctica.AAC.1
MDTTHDPTDLGNEDDDDKQAVADNEVEPDASAPAPLALPPWLGASIDTNEHLRQYYLPEDRGLGHFMTTKEGGRRIDTLTTRELMESRIIWDQGIAYTIPPWA